MKTFTAVLLVIGGLNWGLIGVFNWDLVAAIFGTGAALTRIIYALVGLSALYQAFFYPWPRQTISRDQDRLKRVA